MGRDVPVANSGEGDDAEVKGVKQGKLFSSSFQMLDPTSSEELFQDIKALCHLLVITIMETFYMRNVLLHSWIRFQIHFAKCQKASPAKLCNTVCHLQHKKEKHLPNTQACLGSISVH